MRNSDLFNVLKSQLKELHKSFRDNELAFLALTSKPEGAIRDRVAFALAEALKKDVRYIACREWNRCDVAVLHDHQPALLIELTAMYSYDLNNTRVAAKYREKLDRDLARMQRLARLHQDSKPKLYTLLLMTHPNSDWDKKLDPVLKYGRGNRTTRPKSGKEVKVLIKEQLRVQPLAATGSYVSEWLGTRVEVVYWLFGPHKNAA